MAIDRIDPGRSDLLAKMISSQLGNLKPRSSGKGNDAGAKGRIGETPRPGSGQAVNGRMDPAKSAENARLRKAAQDFEAVFLAQLLKSMRKTVPESELLGNSSESKIYRAMMDEELAAEMARSGGVGLADLLVEQLSPPAVERDDV